MQTTTSGGDAKVGVALVGSAVVMFAALAFLWFSPRPFGPTPALGDMVSQTGSHTVLSTAATNEDVIVVLDSQEEQVLVYRQDATSGVQLLQKFSAAQVFRDARLKSPGRR